MQIMFKQTVVITYFNLVLLLISFSDLCFKMKSRNTLQYYFETSVILINVLLFYGTNYLFNNIVKQN